MLELIGGPDRDRTGDLFHAMEARSQLRHRPTLRKDFTHSQTCGPLSQTRDEFPGYRLGAGWMRARRLERKGRGFRIPGPGVVISSQLGTNRARSGVYRYRVSEHSAAGGAVFSLHWVLQAATRAMRCWLKRRFATGLTKS